MGDRPSVHLWVILTPLIALAVLMGVLVFVGRDNPPTAPSGCRFDSARDAWWCTPDTFRRP